MRFRTIAVAAIAVVAAISTVGCTADSTGELDRGDLIAELQKEGLSQEQAECAADALIEADFAKDELRKLNAGETIADQQKASDYEQALQRCEEG